LGRPVPAQVCAAPGLPKKTYTAHFRFKSEPAVSLMLMAEEGAFSTAMVGCPDSPDGKAMMLVTRFSRCCEGNVQVDCAVARMRGKERQELQASLAAPLETATELVFNKPGCEPVVAEVTVREALPMPVATLPVYPAPPRTMPAPMMPACYPIPTAPAMPVATLLPEPIPVPQPVACEAPMTAGNTCTCPGAPPVCSAPCQPCAYTAVTPVRTVRHCLVDHKDKGVMGCKVDDVGVATFHRTKTECGATGTLTLSAGKTGLHVKGVDWKASADKIDVREDGRVVLHGNVRLMCDKLGVCASVKAEELSVAVKKGKFEKLITK
jgi:hypothetical protein